MDSNPPGSASGQTMTRAVSRQVMLVDESCQGTFSRVFDIQASDLSGEESESRHQPHEGRFPVHVGISGRVATTGRVSDDTAQRAAAEL